MDAECFCGSFINLSRQVQEEYAYDNDGRDMMGNQRWLKKEDRRAEGRAALARFKEQSPVSHIHVSSVHHIRNVETWQRRKGHDGRPQVVEGLRRTKGRGAQVPITLATAKAQKIDDTCSSRTT